MKRWAHLAKQTYLVFTGILTSNFVKWRQGGSGKKNWYISLHASGRNLVLLHICNKVLLVFTYIFVLILMKRFRTWCPGDLGKKKLVHFKVIYLWLVLIYSLLQHQTIIASWVFTRASNNFRRVNNCIYWLADIFKNWLTRKC